MSSMCVHQYLSYCPKERKTFLSPQEEEELIRRLYTGPKVNVYPPRLYEDLPPLKFWNSPASTIENYLQRNVFHRRLQMAYEFNQRKEPIMNLRKAKASKETPLTTEQLTSAIKQLAEDRQYFECLANEKSTLLESEEKTLTTYSENKAVWEKIRPTPKEGSTSENILPQTEEALGEKFVSEIKKRYFDYRNFYRLQNLQQDSQAPLALTIGYSMTPSCSSMNIEEQQSVCFYEYEQDIGSDKLGSKKLPVKFSLETSISKIPKMQQSSLTALIHESPQWREHLTQTMMESADISGGDKDDWPALYIYEGPDKNVVRRGTLLNLKDSVEVAHAKLSKVGKSLIPNRLKGKVSSCLSLTSHKDSFTMMMNRRLGKSNQRHSEHQPNGYNVSPNLSEELNFSHEDSILLAVDRLNDLKDKEDSNLSCDICNNQDDKSIHFMCERHAELHDSQQFAGCTRNRYHSILSKPTFVSVRDSFDIAQNTKSFKERNRHSVECQVEEGEMQGILLKTEMPNVSLGVKGSKKGMKIEDPMKKVDVKSTPSKLKNYLMESVQINQIVTKDNNKQQL